MVCVEAGDRLEMSVLGTKSLECEFTQSCVNILQPPSTALTWGVMAPHPPCTLNSPSLSLSISEFLSVPVSSLFLRLHPYLIHQHLCPQPHPRSFVALFPDHS